MAGKRRVARARKQPQPQIDLAVLIAELGHPNDHMVSVAVSRAGAMLALLYGMNSAGHPAADIAHAPFLETPRTNPDYVGEWTQQALQVEAVGALGDALRFFRDLCAKVQPIIKAAAIEKPATKAEA